MLRFSRLYTFRRMPRKKPTNWDRDLLEPDLQSPAQPITRRLCLRRRLIARFHRRLRLLRIRLLRLNLCCLCPTRALALIPPVPLERRPLLERPRHRRLESLTCDNFLPRGLWVSWVSHRASKAVLSPRHSRYCGPDL